MTFQILAQKISMSYTLIFQTFCLWFSLDHMIWIKSHHIKTYQSAQVCTAHLEHLEWTPCYISLREYTVWGN